MTKKEVYAGLEKMSLMEYISKHANLDRIIMEDVIKQMSPRYTCLRPPGAAGAAVLSESGDLIYGDVRPADGSPTCEELGECLMENGHCVRTIHAEVRAILNAGVLGVSCDGGTMYSILKPCFQCTKVIIASGITKIVYAGAAYDEERTANIIKNANISIIHVDVDLPYGQDLIEED